jgi:hypothetical protein
VKAALGTLGFVGGFMVSLPMFAIGVITATWFLAAEPIRDAAQSEDVDRLWAVTPRRIDTATQDLERLPPANPSPVDVAPQGVDLTTTASVHPETMSEDDDPVGKRYAMDETSGGFASRDHVSDCFSRYRSYRLADNSYQPFGGGPRQQCQ